MSVSRWLWVTIPILGACAGRPLFEKSKPAEELVSKDIPGDKFQVVATIAGSDARTDLRMSLNVRTMLNQAGVTAVRRTGRWETEDEALKGICTGTEGKVDGVLFVKYNGLRLVDCATMRNAYQITGDPEAGGPGIRVMTEKLVNYIQGKAKA